MAGRGILAIALVAFLTEPVISTPGMFDSWRDRMTSGASYVAGMSRSTGRLVSSKTQRSPTTNLPISKPLSKPPPYTPSAKVSSVETERENTLGPPTKQMFINIGPYEIFFPFKVPVSLTDVALKEFAEKGIAARASRRQITVLEASTKKCLREAFVTVKGAPHYFKNGQFTPEEFEAGRDEGVCKLVEIKVYFNPGEKICIVSNVATWREFLPERGNYENQKAVILRKCNFRTQDELTNAPFEKLYFNLETEPELYQNVFLVLYQCKIPKVPLRSQDEKIWKVENIGNNVVLKLKDDGTKEHVENLREAGCVAKGSFSMTMYGDRPMANTTAIAFNCPGSIDGYEKQITKNGRLQYVRKWRKDWAQDDCRPTITKSKLNDNGDLELVTATNFQDDKTMDIQWFIPVMPRGYGFDGGRKTIFGLINNLAAEVLESASNQGKKNVKVMPSIVRRYV